MHNVQPSIFRKGIQPSTSAFLLNPRITFNFSRVGLKSHTVFKVQVTWQLMVRWIGQAQNLMRRSSGHGSTEDDQTNVA